MVRYAVGLVALLTVFSSCDPKVNLTGQYEEKPLIYGLMNPKESVQLFRIQKAFLGEESAFVMAQNADSSYFKYEDLFVELVEYNTDGNETNRWALDTVLINNKETGDPDDDEIDFFGPTQRLYSTSQDKILDFTGSSTVSINANREYEITLKKRPVFISAMSIENMDTIAPIADSKINVVNTSSFKFTTPNAQSAQVIAPKLTLINEVGEATSFAIKFSAAGNAALYEVWLRFHYREIRDNVETLKSLEWRARTIQADPEELGEIQVNPISAQEIYSRIGSEIPVESGVTRKIGKANGAQGDPFPIDGHTQDFDIVVRMAGDDLFKYIDINNPNFTGVLQDRPIYTNINNGLGVFSSRTQADFLNRLYLSPESLDELVDGEYTSGRGFVVDPD